MLEDEVRVVPRSESQLSTESFTNGIRDGVGDDRSRRTLDDLLAGIDRNLRAHIRDDREGAELQQNVKTKARASLGNKGMFVNKLCLEKPVMERVVAEDCDKNTKRDDGKGFWKAIPNKW